MSRRNYESTSHQNRMSKFLVTNDDLFEYVSNLPCQRKAADLHLLIAMYSVYRKHQTSPCDSPIDIRRDPLQSLELSHTTKDHQASQCWRYRCSGERTHWSFFGRDLKFDRFYWRPLQRHRGWPRFEKRQIPGEVVEGFGAEITKHSNGKGSGVRRELLILAIGYN